DAARKGGSLALHVGEVAGVRRRQQARRAHSAPGIPAHQWSASGRGRRSHRCEHPGCRDIRNGRPRHRDNRFDRLASTRHRGGTLKLAWMMFANHAEIAPNSLLYINGGAWDTINVQAPLPAEVPQAETGAVAVFQGTIVVRVLFHSTEAGRIHLIRITVSDED